MHESGGAAATKNLPLAVDMDGALLRTDVLAEGMASLLFRRPFTFLWSLRKLTKGRAAFKQAVAAQADIDVGALPLRADFVAFLTAQRQAGRVLHLATAADAAIAARVADRVGLFSGITASDGDANLKGPAKRAALEAQFPGGFAYAGDSRADLAVWTGAKAIVLAGARPGTARRARALPAPVEAVFPERAHRRAAWLRALNPPLWAANLVLFLPLLGARGDWAALRRCTIGFGLVCAAAAAASLIAALADLPADRQRQDRRRRPFAAGDLDVAHGLAAAAGLVLLPLAAALSLSPIFAAMLVAYLALAACLCQTWKQGPLLRVVPLVVLCAALLPMGAVLAGGAR